MEKYRVGPRTKVDLSLWDPADTSQFEGDKIAALAEVGRLTDRLEELQEMLYARQDQRVLVVLQAMDTGGKDGTIRRVFDGVNPLGVKVASFRRPTPDELAHDFLWRVHPHVPASGEIAIFNRSHYEDVLVVRVHELVPKARWEKRFRHIVEFERLLAEEGTTILKFYLHISKEEQRRRLQDRIDNPEKRWKFSPVDVEERKLWNSYQSAYQDALSKTSTEKAPWYIVPADNKWYRDLVVATVLVNTLESMKLVWPQPEDDLTGIVVE